MWLALLGSFLCTNLPHWFMLYSQRHERKMTISYHAVHSRRTLLIYLAAHIGGGLFFLVFAHEFFYQQLHSDFLWTVTVLAVVSEWLQALLPVKGKWEIYHFIAAWSMGVFMSVLLVAAPLVVGLDNGGWPALIASLSIVIGGGLLTLKTKKTHFWIPQTMYFFSFYIVMLMVAW